MTNWHTVPQDDIAAAIVEFKSTLPGWWYSVGECQVSCDASCGPTRESADIALVQSGNCFDEGFHADLAQPSSLAEALRDVLAQGIEARRAATGTGAVHESPVA